MDIIEVTKKKIKEKYDVTDAKALQLAKDIIYQIDAHGGNPQNLNELDIVIDTVVKSWIELEQEKEKNEN